MKSPQQTNKVRKKYEQTIAKCLPYIIYVLTAAFIIILLVAVISFAAYQINNLLTGNWLQLGLSTTILLAPILRYLFKEIPEKSFLRLLIERNSGPR